MSVLYTIGYASKSIDLFIGQLYSHGIDVVADIRSVPYSKAFPDYRKETLAAHLRGQEINYVYLGSELGPRSRDDAHYDARGQVQFGRIMQSRLFLNGIDRLVSGIKKNYAITLMCAEKDPLNCHRSLLVTHYLTHNAPLAIKRHFDNIQHITHDGILEGQLQLEQRLISQFGECDDLFSSQDEPLLQAYQKQLEMKAYRKT